MYCLPYKVETLSDVLIMGNRSEGNMVRSFEYIPGSTMLGVFVSHYTRNKLSSDMVGSAHLDSKFYSWFLNGEFIFSNAYPTIKGECEEFEFYPTPLSIQMDKKNRIYNLVSLDDDSIRFTKPLGGYAKIVADQVLQYPVAKKLNFHHQRDERIKGLSQEGNIFFYESLERGQIFSGEIFGSEESLQELKDMMGNSQMIRIGRSKNTQYGKALLELFDIVPYTPPLIDSDEDTIILMLQSPAVFFNQYGYPEVSLEIFEHYLQKVLGTKDFEIETCFTRIEEFENYIGVWRMKKPLDKAFSAGSTFKVYFATEINEEIIHALQKLELEGIGERRNEGFGKVCIYTTMSETYSFARKVPLKPTQVKPEGLPPELVQSIIKNILKERILQETELIAIKEAEMFQFFRPSNSQLSRLEHLLKISKNPKDYIRKLNELRKPAKESLENCHNGRESLWHRLVSERILDWEKISVNIKGLTEIIEDVNVFDIHSGLSFQREIYETYWSTFFRRMRKLNQLGAVKQ